MTLNNWQLRKPVSAIVFDCDGTLSSIEGIDFLAEQNNVGATIKAMTRDAMGKTGLNPILYQQRLDLVLPSFKQVCALGHEYFAQKTPDVIPVLSLLMRLKKSLYLISAGVNPAVKLFGEMLQFFSENIYAVDLSFNKDGNYLDFEKNSPLVSNDGKRFIVETLKSKHQEIIHIGDGLNDVVTCDLVTRFIGYGGFFYRKNIADLCEFYINTLSFSAIIPLVITEEEYSNLLPDEKNLYQQGLGLLHGRVD